MSGLSPHDQFLDHHSAQHHQYSIRVFCEQKVEQKCVQEKKKKNRQENYSKRVAHTLDETNVHTFLKEFLLTVSFVKLYVHRLCWHVSNRMHYYTICILLV